ncbi:MAG: zinc ABC transporter substrate-binding protein [Candidatus Electryoneaceae bacterium]|nr:zinc ABC transporter substrate-binding protein [Candidatus Electryoneaceae bacterium]
MTYKYYQIIILLFALLVLNGCRNDAETIGDSRLKVFVCIPPQANFLKRIGGDHVKVDVLVRSGQSPHNYQPTPQQMNDLGGANLFFAIGLPFEERLMERIQSGHQQLTVVNTDARIAKRTIAHHEDHEDNDHVAYDPHIWLLPTLIAIQAISIADALRSADPDHSEDYWNNLNQFLLDIDATDKRIRRMLEPYTGRSFYVFHPSFGYFAHHYGLRQVAVEMGGKSPTPKQLNGLIRQARAENVKVLFVQPQFDRRSAEAIAEAIDGTVTPIDPMAEDVLQNLETIAEKIAQTLGE